MSINMIKGAAIIACAFVAFNIAVMGDTVVTVASLPGKLSDKIDQDRKERERPLRFQLLVDKEKVFRGTSGYDAVALELKVAREALDNFNQVKTSKLPQAITKAATRLDAALAVAY